MDSHRSNLLRTLSDSGEMRDVIALLMEGRDVAGEEEGGGVHQGASVVDHEAQRVSSPGSENSKDGKEGGPREGGVGGI